MKEWFAQNGEQQPNEGSEIQNAIQEVLQPLFNMSKFVEVCPADVQEQADKYGVTLKSDEE